jgi:hypothetical protein
MAASRFSLLIPFLLIGCASEAVAPDATDATRPDFLAGNPENADLNNNGFVCSQESHESSLKPMPQFPGVYVDDTFAAPRFCPPSFARIAVE